MEIILNDAQLRQGFAKIKKDRDKLQAKFKKAGDFEAYNRLADTMREWKERVGAHAVEPDWKAFLPILTEQRVLFLISSTRRKRCLR